jgi:hypothetical protein
MLRDRNEHASPIGTIKRDSPIGQRAQREKIQMTVDYG